jgi:hypothetical protein
VKVFIGYDEREKLAFEVACKTLRDVSSLTATPLDNDRLAAAGLLWRPVDTRGRKYDIVSNAYCSTDFANSRFLTPLLAQTGWALFVDADVVFLQDPAGLLAHADPRKAVMVVQHPQSGSSGVKMDGQVQEAYLRKNWSSVMLFNCDHPANRRLSLRDVNERPGRDLHRFYWLADDEIGSLPDKWNWLVNVNPKPDLPAIAHFTLGGPWFKDWDQMPGANHDHDEIWLEALRG